MEGHLTEIEATLYKDELIWITTLKVAFDTSSIDLKDISDVSIIERNAVRKLGGWILFLTVAFACVFLDAFGRDSVRVLTQTEQTIFIIIIIASSLVYLVLRYINNRESFLTTYQINLKTADYVITAVTSTNASYVNNIVEILNKAIKRP